MTESALQTIQEELKAIRNDLSYLKEHMVDVDVILSEEERRLLNESLKHEKEGKLVSLEELENARHKAR